MQMSQADTTRVRMPAEWEQHERCLMGWPDSNCLWGAPLEDLRSAYADVAHAIRGFEPVTMIVSPDELANARHYLGSDIEIVPLRVQHLAAPGLESGHGAGLIDLHQPAESNHIGGQYGGKAALDAFFSHAMRRLSKKEVSWSVLAPWRGVYRASRRLGDIFSQSGALSQRQLSDIHRK